MTATTHGPPVAADRSRTRCGHDPWPPRVEPRCGSFGLAAPETARHGVLMCKTRFCRGGLFSMPRECCQAVADVLSTLARSVPFVPSIEMSPEEVGTTGLWEWRNLAPSARFPKRGGRASSERPPRCHFQSPRLGWSATKACRARHGRASGTGGPRSGCSSALAWPPPVGSSLPVAAGRRVPSRPSSAPAIQSPAVCPHTRRRAPSCPPAHTGFAAAPENSGCRAARPSRY
jgi:hypothetical protein